MAETSSTAPVTTKAFGSTCGRWTKPDAIPIQGTEGGAGPFLSPDGEWIGFWANGQLKKVRIEGGPPVTLCDTFRPPYGASWGPSGTIVYGQYAGGILEISADGGEPRAMSALSQGEFSHRLPQFLPDGSTVLFTILKGEMTWDEAQIAAYSLKTGERKALVENGADARYAPTGHLIFARLGTLMAVPFDALRLEITGGPVGVIEGVWQAIDAINLYHDTGAAQFSFSSSGSLAYVPGGIFADADIEDTLVWVDLDGAAEPLPAPPFSYTSPRLSPDGQQVAAFSMGLNYDIWALRYLAREPDPAYDRKEHGKNANLDAGRRTNCFSIRPIRPLRHLLDAHGWKRLRGAAHDDRRTRGSCVVVARRRSSGICSIHREQALRHLGAPSQRRATAFYPITVPRGVPDVLTRWPLVGLCFERIGASRGLHYSVPGARA